MSLISSTNRASAGIANQLLGLCKVRGAALGVADSARGCRLLRPTCEYTEGNVSIQLPLSKVVV